MLLLNCGCIFVGKYSMCLHAALPKDFVKGLLPKLTALLPGGSSRNCKAMVLRELQLNIKTSWGSGERSLFKKEEEKTNNSHFRPAETECLGVGSRNVHL